jgi:L-fuconolactonase
MSERGIGPQVIIDTHQHFWMRDDQTFLPDDLRAAVATTDVVATVYIECDSWYRPDGPEPLRSVGETEWVVANAPDFVAGIVGKADLRLGAAVAEVLDAHAAAGGDLFKGIRQTTLYEPTPDSWQMEPSPGPGLLSDASFREGFTVLDRFGLRFEALVWFHQLPEVVDLARAFPDTTIVLNHLGGPSGIRPWRDRRPEMLSSWRHHLAAAAECPNIVAKVGGIGMGIYGVRWARDPQPPSAETVAEFWRDEVRFVLDTFGPDRCMAESNFPVDLNCMSYGTLWDAMRIMVGHLDTAEQALFFSGTACEVYRLDIEI